MDNCKVKNNYFGYFKGMYDINQNNIKQCSVYESVFADFYSDCADSNTNEMSILSSIINEDECEILELACGSGRLILPLSRNIKYRITGVDNSSDMINICEKRCASSNVNIKCCDMLGFCENTQKKYDVVLISAGSIALFDSYDDLNHFFCIVKNKVLKDNGKLYFTLIDQSEELLQSLETPKFLFNNKKRSYIAIGQKVISPERILVNMYSEICRKSTSERFISSGKKLILDKNIIIDILHKYKYEVLHHYKEENRQGEYLSFCVK